MIETLNKIIEMFFRVYNKAVEYGLPTDNICLYARPELLKLLGLKDKLEIRYAVRDIKFEYVLKVKIERKIWKTNYENEQWSTDIYIWNPDWLIEQDSFYGDITATLINKES